MSTEDGGAAFPHDEIHDQMEPFRHLQAETGMSLRNYFAAHSTGAIGEASISGAEAVLGRRFPSINDRMGLVQFWADYRALVRFIEADAMIAVSKAALP